MLHRRLLSLFFLSLFLAACWDAPRSTAPETPKPHFELDYQVPGKTLAEASQAAGSGQPFTATIRISNPNAPLGKTSSDAPESEAVDVNVRFTGTEYLVQNPDSGNWVTLTEVLAEEAEEGRDVLAKVANDGEPLELPEKTVTADPDGDVLIIAGTLVAGAGVVLWQAAKWGWKKLFGKKKPKIKDPGVKYDSKGKIEGQMNERGWTKESVEQTIKNPDKNAQAIDRRGGLNEPATAYFDKSGHYVVRNNKTGEVIQISNKNDPTGSRTAA